MIDWYLETSSKIVECWEGAGPSTFIYLSLIGIFVLWLICGITMYINDDLSDAVAGFVMLGPIVVIICSFAFPVIYWVLVPVLAFPFIIIEPIKYIYKGL